MDRAMRLGRGEPYLWGDVYMENKPVSSYGTDIVNPSVSNIIRRFHRDNGYNIPEDSSIIMGLGSTQVMMGLIQALGYTYYSRPFSYPDYRSMVDQLRYHWVEDADVEFVTCPNNPDGKIRSPITEADIILWDMVYAWPWYGYNHGELVQRNLSYDRRSILIFSCSKSIGLGGARVGYAIIPREVMIVYPHLINRYVDYVILSTQGISTPGVMSCMSVMSRRSSFPEIRHILVRRYEEMVELLQSLVPGVRILSSSGFYYMWIYWPGKNLHSFLNLGIGGSFFGVTDEYVRINMCAGQREWKELLNS